MKTVKFLEDVRLKDYRLGTPQEEHYALGQVVALSDDVAQRWLRRGKAVLVEDVVAPATLPAPPTFLPAAGAGVPEPATVPAVMGEAREETVAESRKPTEETPSWRRPDRRQRK